jgi:hypothetical protein
MVSLVKLAVLAAASATVVSLGVSAQAAGPAGWRVTNVYGHGADNYDPPVQPGQAGALAAGGTDSAWTIWTGCIWPCDSGKFVTTLEHWNGHQWAAVAAAKLHDARPFLVTASSAKDAWVVGAASGSKQDVTLHWNGSAWSKSTLPSWALYINGAGETDIYPADFGASDLWLFSLGSYVGQQVAYAAHYSAGRWTKSVLPDVPSSVTAISSTDIWATGVPLPGKPQRIVLMHWNGHRWSTSAFPGQRVTGHPFDLFSGPGGLWAMWAPAKVGARGYLLHFTGKKWARVDLPAGDSFLGSFAGDGHGGFWMTAVGPGRQQAQLFLHWSAGHWAVSHVPSAPGVQLGQVAELAQIPGTGSVWAIGHLYGPGGGTTLNRAAIWRYRP